MPGFNVTPEPTPEDAAALIGAIERFLADTTTPSAEGEPAPSGWQRAALLEATGRSDEHAIWR
jgi:hypothetical protein